MDWSATAARSHARRLEEYGFLERVPMVRGDGSLFFATRRGIHFLGLPIPPASTPAPTWWAHDSACAWAAALYSVRGRRFIGSRELLESRKWSGSLEWTDRNSVHQSRHRPDLVGEGPDGGAVAIEVELAPKSKSRLDAILQLHDQWLYAGQSKRLVYICGDERGKRRIEAAASRAIPGAVQSGAVRVLLLTRVIEEITEVILPDRRTAGTSARATGA